MKVLIVGGGGREHALAWKCAQSPRVKTVWVAPGNAGTAHEGDTICNAEIAADDIENLISFAKQQRIDLTIVGPEAPLAGGIVDRFTQQGLAIFGPSQAAAQLESSKTFCKEFMQRHHIPTAEYQCFTDYPAAAKYLAESDLPIVIKADGLAAGKGVFVCQTQDEAHDTIDQILNKNQFGKAGQSVVIEHFLPGEEASFIALSDGENLLALASSQDHKARDDGDLGPNTGGMGAYSPAPLVTAEVEARIMEQIMKPTIKGMAAEGVPFVGFLYAGLMIDEQGQASVLEFNCRMGDPETQPLMMRLQSDLVELCSLCLQKKIDTAVIEWKPQAALGVVLASAAYPDSYQKGQTIHGLEQIDSEQTKVFHAATAMKDGQFIANGGRVLSVISLGDDIAQAQQRAYQACQSIRWEGMFYRKDIGWKALK